MTMQISGLGSVNQLGEIKAKFRPRRTLLVSGRGSFAASGAEAAVVQHFTADELVRFCDFAINPKIEDALKGVSFARSNAVDLILAVGGGSVLDMAKLIKAFISKPDRANDIAEGKHKALDPGIPLVATPTTAGSGSEATHFAVVYKGTSKYSLASPIILPDATILDGNLIQSNSSFQKAVNGLDALAQGIESAWAVGATEESRAFAFEAVKLCWTALPKIVDSSRAEDHQTMIEAAHLAGKAINISKTTAAHAFSYAFTSHHAVPHGQAVWLTLPAIFQRHADAKLPALSPVIEKLTELLSIKNLSSCQSELEAFVASLGVETDMSTLGADTHEKRRFLSTQVNLERLSNNPVNLTERDIAEIFKLA